MIPPRHETAAWRLMGGKHEIILGRRQKWKLTTCDCGGGAQDVCRKVKRKWRRGEHENALGRFWLGDWAFNAEEIRNFAALPARPPFAMMRLPPVRQWERASRSTTPSSFPKSFFLYYWFSNHGKTQKATLSNLVYIALMYSYRSAYNNFSQIRVLIQFWYWQRYISESSIWKPLPEFRRMNFLAISKQDICHVSRDYWIDNKTEGSVARSKR